MRSRWLLLLALVGAGLTPASGARAQQPQPQTQIAQVKLSSVVDWQNGTAGGLLVSNNEDGELRLAPDAYTGIFESNPLPASFAFNAVGATWKADLPAGTTVALEVRATNAISPTAAWGAWQPLPAGDARSQSDPDALASPDVRAFPASSNYLQVRATLSSTVPQASATLSELTLFYISSVNGPLFSAGLPGGVPVAGPATLTRRPAYVQRLTWSARITPAAPARAQPRGIVLHQVDAAPDASDPLVLMRALTAYQTQALGWDDTPYHYLIDNAGTLYEGRNGGATSAVTRLAGGDSAIHIALLGSAGAAPSEAAQATLIGLLAYLSDAYSLPLGGQHALLASGERVTRPNLAAHSEVAPEATDTAKPLLDLLPQLRQRGDQSVVRSRWYFAEGNVRDYGQRLAIFNPTNAAASATVSLLPSGGPPVTQILAIPAGGRVDLTANDVVSATSDLPAVVESNGRIIVERAMGVSNASGVGTDIDGGPGVQQPARVWYFAEGSTASGFSTYLALFNPQPASVRATLTYMLGDGTTQAETVDVPPQGRTVIAAADRLANTGFGVQVLAAQPIVAERTMRFGTDGAGLHIGTGIGTLSRRWYFAEGTTARPYSMRLLVLNPNLQVANTTISFLTPDGTSLSRRYAIPPTTRLVVDVNEVVPDLGVSSVVESDRPLAVERAMYFNDGNAGTVTAGAIAPAYVWRFADGRTNDATEYLLLSNPGRRQARVSVEFVLANGSRATRELTMPGSARYTLSVHEVFPGQAQIAATVRSTQPIVAERSLYPGGGARGGSTALGVPER
jgi:hypothetical protein